MGSHTYVPLVDMASTLLLYSSAVLVSAYLLWVANPSYSVAIMSSKKVVPTLCISQYVPYTLIKPL